MQDLLIFVLKGISFYAQAAAGNGVSDAEVNKFVYNGLFKTITNANFDKAVFIADIKKGLELRDRMKKTAGAAVAQISDLPDCCVWSAET
jgi:hydroxylamine reductase